MQLPDIPFVVLDTETTGFVPKVNRVIEYAHTVYRGGELVDTYDELISIPGDIPEVVQVITRIRPEALEGKKAFEEHREKIVAGIGEDTIIVGQNILFDINMLKGEGIDLSDRPWIDTSMLASLVYPELASYSLGYISAVLELEHTPVHRALGDVHATTQLLSKCWERLLELPQDILMDVKAIAAKSAPGYQSLFAALPASEHTNRPTWMQMPTKQTWSDAVEPRTIAKPAIGTVDLIEESLDATMLQSVIDAAVKDTSTVHWIAVKNLTAACKRLSLSENVRVLQPPFLLLDAEAAERLGTKEQLSPDEATLLMKLQWYTPKVVSDAPVHGEEKSLWSGTLACTEQSETYLAQFADLPSVVLLDHRQLLAFIQNPEHSGNAALTPDAHIIIDDASMLEDTASKAYGHYVGINDARASAQGNPTLEKCIDLLQIWIESIRNEQDVRMITPHDLSSPQISALRKHIAEALQQEDLPQQTAHQFGAIAACIEDEATKRITWIETRQDGAQFLHSVPESVAELLQKDLFEKFPVSMLIPPLSGNQMQECIHRGVERAINPDVPRIQKAMTIEFPEELSGRKVLSDPPDGKTIILSGSRRIIEDYFIRFTEDLEKRDITLICQNLSGGVNRMQAEFLAAASPAIWVLTPWTFESIQLPEGTVDHLIVDALPFDNPSQPVFAARGEHCKNAFVEYSMPRLTQRLFRCLRTFRRVAKDDADITVIDNRITEKRYGKTIRKYLELCCEKLTAESAVNIAKGGAEDFPENWQMNLF